MKNGAKATFEKSQIPFISDLYKIFKFLCIESEGQSKRLIARPYGPQGDKSCFDQN